MAMTPEQRNTARATLVRIRDYAHEAVRTLDVATDLEAMGEPAAGAVPALCASVCGTITEMLADTETIALMKSACELETT